MEISFLITLPVIRNLMLDRCFGQASVYPARKVSEAESVKWRRFQTSPVSAVLQKRVGCDPG